MNEQVVMEKGEFEKILEQERQDAWADAFQCMREDWGYEFEEFDKAIKLIQSYHEKFKDWLPKKEAKE